MRGIAASWVVTGDASEAPIERGAVVLDAHHQVVAVGPRESLQREFASARWEAHRSVLLPGLINAHTHLELSALRGQVAGGRGFVPWVTELMAARERFAPELDIEALDRAVSELLGSGTVAVGEVSNTLAAVPYLGSSPIVGRIFHEVFGLRRESGVQMLALAQERRAAVAQWPANLSYALAPHTLYTLHPELVREVLARTRASSQLTTLHLAEHAAERKFLADGGGPFASFLAARGASQDGWVAPGVDAVRYAQSLGALGEDVLCVHLCDADAAELALVAALRAPVVVCPRSNLHIEVKLPPLVAMLRAGIEPALGTDSLASCASLDVLDDARALAERFSSIPARTLLAMATSYGANALGFGSRLGTIAAGRAPGILSFAHGADVPADPEKFLLSRAARDRSLIAPAANGPFDSTEVS